MWTVGGTGCDEGEGEGCGDRWYVGGLSTVYEGGKKLIRIAGSGSNNEMKPIPKIVKGLNEDDVQHSQDTDTKTKSKKSKHREKKKPTTTGHPPDLDWIDEDLTESYEDMSIPGSGDTAQVSRLSMRLRSLDPSLHLIRHSYALTYLIAPHRIPYHSRHHPIAIIVPVLPPSPSLFSTHTSFPF
jgi:hypothetical protein